MKNIRPFYTHIDNEDGFVLVLAMLIMVVLIVIGVSSINTSKTELLITGNEKIHKKTFYEADSGAELGIALTEEALRIDGFSDNTTSDNSTFPAIGGTEHNLNNDIIIVNRNFENNPSATQPSDTNRDIYFPYNYGSADSPHTNLTIGGTAQYTPGSGLQMVSGYEGLGKGAARGGTSTNYDIYSQHKGYRNSETSVLLEWRHVNL